MLRHLTRNQGGKYVDCKMDIVYTLLSYPGWICSSKSGPGSLRSTFKMANDQSSPLGFPLFGIYNRGLIQHHYFDIEHLKLKAENMKLQKQHRKVKEELNRLRNASIDEDADQFNSDDAENITQSESE